MVKIAGLRIIQLSLSSHLSLNVVMASTALFSIVTPCHCLSSSFACYLGLQRQMCQYVLDPTEPLTLIDNP